MTALADHHVLADEHLEDQAWDEHARLAELGVDTPDDPCPDCASLDPCAFDCRCCTRRSCEPHDRCGQPSR